MKKKTAAKKKRAALKKMNDWCKKNRHKPMEWQHAKICQKLQGHYAYYGITPNSGAIRAFRQQVLCIWRYWLNRRSREQDGMKWEHFSMILKTVYPVPYAHLVHKAPREEQLCMIV